MQSERPIRQVVTETAEGPVRGAGVPGSGVVAHLGVPFAAPPVGALRFSPPSPHPPWSEPRDGSRPGPAAPQTRSRLAAVMGERTAEAAEDNCLTVNVWAPEGAEGLPVLLWFHGGGWNSGCGGWDWYDGARLAALGNIVVVTANYRLGALGYLRLPGIGADNLGMQDQAAALRWVHAGIAAFGGDPGAITVGGQSAGADTAVALAADPATAPLVRRVVAQSAPWGTPPQAPEEADERAADYLRLLNIKDEDPGPALRAAQVEDLVSAYARLAAATARTGHVAPPLHPVLGGFGLARPWQQALAAGALDGPDLLLGDTEDEAAAFLPGGGADDPGHAAGMSAQAFQEGTRRVAEHRARHGRDTYVYRFARPAPGSPLGAAHCSELPFLFGTFEAYPDAPMLGAVSEADRALSRSFGRAVAAFTATGSPKGDVPWPVYPSVRRLA